MENKNRWESFDMSHLVSRLEEAKSLLEQAAALGAAQDRSRLEVMVRQSKAAAEVTRGNSRRRRFR